MSQRKSHTYAWLVSAAVIAACVSAPLEVCAQPGGGMGDFPTSPNTIFGKKKDNREISGPSLSATDEPVADIRIIGNTTIPTSQILNQLQTRIGRPFDPALVQKDVRKLAARGWFVDVQPSYEQSPTGGRVVIFKVIERPIVRYVEFLGNYEIRTKKLSKETELKVGGPVDPYAVQEAKRKIIDLYHRSGYNNVQVSILEGDKTTDHGIVFVINEGEMQKIWKVEFVGNEFVSESRLKTRIDSKPPLMMMFKGYVDREQIDQDVNKLVAYYRSFGYFDAKVGRELVFDDKNKWVTLRFVIHEGRRYQVESVAFIGNRLFSNDSLTSGVELKNNPTPSPNAFVRMYRTVRPLPPGPQPFEQDVMNSDVAWLKELYGSQGYIFADIKAEPIFLEEPGKLKLMYHIDEGKRWRVGNVYVHINGENPHTKIQTALNRLSIKSGQVADIREVKASERRLQASGLFMTDPVHNVSPKITFHIPEVNDTEIAKRGTGYRGQSPDGANLTRSIELLPAPDLPAVNNPQPNGPPLIAPPQGSSGVYNVPPSDSRAAEIKSFMNDSIRASSEASVYAPTATATPFQTFKVTAPADLESAEDTVAMHIYIDTETVAPNETGTNSPSPSGRGQGEGALESDGPSAQSMRQPQQPLSPAVQPANSAAPQVYEVRRQPYDDNTAAPPQQSTSLQWGSRPTYPNAPASTAATTTPATSTVYKQPTTNATNNPYQRLVVRTQSPYQPPSQQPAAGATAQQPGQPYSPVGYGATYGGQTVGATGPDAVAPGANRYAVQQAAITEPQLPPDTTATPAPAPAFGPSPMTAPGAVETLPTPPSYASPPAAAPQYAPAAPGYGAPPAYCPPGMAPAGLAPDPNIAPVPPLHTNPQPMPSTPLDPFTQPFTDPAVDMDVVLSEAQTGRLMLGVAVNSDAGLVGQILLDEQNFDWTRYPTSWEDFASGRAWRGAGQRFRLEAAPGTEVQRYLASFTEPYFLDTPVSLGLSGSYFTRRYRDWDEQRTGGRVSLGYQWLENDLSAGVAYRGEDVKISNPSTLSLPELNEVLGDNAIHGFKFFVANDTRDSAFLATEGHFFQVELEQVVGSFQYPRAVIDGRQYFLLNERPDHSGRHVLTASSRVGFTGQDTPIFENFFAGGFSSLRGFEFRGASPVVQNVQVGGQFEFINTLEYLFPLTADDMIHGVAFVDFGTVEQNVSMHADNFRVAPGFGLRITVPAMGPAPIALDFAFPVAKADTDETQVFSFNIGLQR